MRWPWLKSCLAVTLLCTLACEGGQTGSEGAPHQPPDAAVNRQDAATGGSGGHGSTGGNWMGGNGPGPCTSDAECMRDLEDAAERLRQPVQAPPEQLVEADCEARPAQCPGRAFCKCVITTRNASGEVNAEAFALGLDAQCDVIDRAGQCQLPAADFAGCQVGDACACATQCEQALAVRAAAAARTLEVEARHAECGPDAMCRGVLRIGDRCFSNGKRYDCALSDQDILRSAFPPPPDAGAMRDCTQGCDAGSGTTGSVTASCAVGACSNCYDDAPALDCSEPDGGE